MSLDDMDMVDRLTMQRDLSRRAVEHLSRERDELAAEVQRLGDVIGELGANNMRLMGEAVAVRKFSAAVQAERNELRHEVERLKAANANLISHAEILADEIVLGTAPEWGAS